MNNKKCTHKYGTYTEKDEPGVKRCNDCDVVMNMTKREFEGDLYDSDFWDDEDEDY
jgi:hypothetical protein